MAENDMRSKQAAPDVSRELMPVMVDRIASEDPNGVFVTLASESGNRQVTYKQYANAINGVAFWLESQLGRSYTNECLAYIGTGGGDLFYPILLIAAVKAGYYMLFNSPRNSVEAHVNLLGVQNCNTLLVSEPQPPYVAPLLEAQSIQLLILPAIDKLLDPASPSPDYEYRKPFDEACREPFLALHTSGSTGFPKPVIWNLACPAIIANAFQATMPDGTVPITQLYREDIVFSALPMFHAAGLTTNILAPIFCRHKLVLLAPGSLLNADSVLSLAKSACATAAILPPSIVDEISKQSDISQTLAQMNYILVGGGSITDAAGDIVSKHTKILNILGATELGTFSQIEVGREDWAYMHFSPLTGAVFRPYSDDEYELVIVRKAELQRYQSCFELFPDLQEFSSHDLFRKHPHQAGLWRYCGRSDDIIVFLNGEKTNPVSMEDLISSHPECRSALVLGQGRFEAGLLIEPINSVSLSKTEKAELIEKVWPTLQQANEQCPRHARVAKSRILFTTPEKPMSRAGKGTVQRRATIANYSAEIDALYTDADYTRHDHDLVQIDQKNVYGSIMEIISSTTSIVGLARDDDLFSRGMDSVQVIQTVRLLKLALEKVGMNADGIGPSTIYTNPTAANLTAAVELLLHDSGRIKERHEEARIEKMRSMLANYSPARLTEKAETEGPRKTPSVVMITGTTGALGSYVLDTLVANESISRIICLNRSIDSKQKQIQASVSRGLEAQWDSQRVTFLTGDLSKSDLGLDDEQYAELSETVDLIIHNAWRVDFNLSLDSYEQDHVKGVRNLIDLSVHSLGRATIFFVSSIGSVLNWPVYHPGPVPEAVINDFRVPGAMGYTESKHVSEQLLDAAGTKCHVPISICRVGQIAGPVLTTRGAWNKREWLPSLVQSSQYLGVLPDSLGNLSTIDWIPIDILSTILAELALRPIAEAVGSGSRVYHAVNPKLTTWDALLPSVLAKMGAEVRIVSLAAWVGRLRASAVSCTTEEAIQSNPALKLMDFYEAMLSTEKKGAALQTQSTCEASPTLKSLGPVKGEWMARWMDQWKDT